MSPDTTVPQTPDPQPVSDPKAHKTLVHFQQLEITGAVVYDRIADLEKDPHNKQVLTRLAEEETAHYEMFKALTGVDVKPARFRVFFMVLMARLLGITFTLKMLENNEGDAQQQYSSLYAYTAYPELEKAIADEERHEQDLLDLLEEERLEYVGSMVLGLNDALVELTGTLAGLTFAFQDTRLIALSGLITGISASFSMASSEYLANRATEKGGRALKAAVYTGVAYIITVILLVLPYLVLSNYVVALVCTLIVAVLIIMVFNFYISVAKDLSFRKHFLEMAGLSLGVAVLSFVIGIVIRQLLGVDI